MGRNNDANNVRVNDSSKEENINVKGNAFTGVYQKYKQAAKKKRSGSNAARIRRAQRIADDLLRKFGPRAKSSYRYFCKCAYCLPENVIWECYESSQHSNVANSLAYFLASTKAQPQMA